MQDVTYLGRKGKGIRHREWQQREVDTTPWFKGKWGENDVSGIRERA